LIFLLKNIEKLFKKSSSFGKKLGTLNLLEKTSTICLIPSGNEPGPDYPSPPQQKVNEQKNANYHAVSNQTSMLSKTCQNFNEEFKIKIWGAS
jgi:hypothetical protein